MIAVKENIYEDMKDILEKEILISDLFPPTNVVRTDFSVLFARLATRSNSLALRIGPCAICYEVVKDLFMISLMVKWFSKKVLAKV